MKKCVRCSSDILTGREELCESCYQRDYYVAHRDRIKARTSAFRCAHLDRHCEYNKKYRRLHPEQRIRHAMLSRILRKEKPEVYKAHRIKWRMLHKDDIRKTIPASEVRVIVPTHKMLDMTDAGIPWTDDELLILRKNYYHGASFCRECGLKRSLKAIQHKALCLGLIANRKPHNLGKTKDNYEPLKCVSESLTGRKQSDAHRLHHSQSKRRLMADPVYKARFVGRLMSSWARSPNGAEKRFLDACEGLPIRYTGDGSFMIGYKNPDFLVTGQLKVIEVMCMFFHDRTLNPTVLSHRTVNSTLSYYKRNGYQCLIINHKSTYFPKWVRKQVMKFIGGDGCRENDLAVSGENPSLR